MNGAMGTTMPRLGACLATCLVFTACGGHQPASSTQNTLDLPESGTSDPVIVTEPPPTSTSGGWEEIMTTTDETTDEVGEPTAEVSSGEIPEPAVCGDGIVAGDEECDDGDGGNGVHNECDPFCKKTRCGDGIVQSDEACDDGEQNSDEPMYGEGCTKQCGLGPRCGDGEVQPEEDCEPGDTMGGLPCGADCHYLTRIIFLTSEPTTGAMNGLTGPSGADARCQELATGAGLTGSFKAWLMVKNQLLSARFSEFPDFHAPILFTTRDGLPVAGSLQELVDQGPQHAISTTESNQVLFQKLVWTNIKSDGIFAGDDCGAWKNEDGPSALVGHSGYADEASEAYKTWRDLRQWTDISAEMPCDAVKVHTYCIQVE